MIVTHRRDLPLVRELGSGVDSLKSFERLRSMGGVIFLDSAMTHGELGRYSFIAADPFREFLLPARRNVTPADGEPFAELQAALQAFKTETSPDLPPFQGGAAGLFGYGLGRYLERLPSGADDPFEIPDLAVGFYDWVLAVDHVRDRAWIISQGFPEMDPSRRTQRAEERIRAVLEALDSPAAVPEPPTNSADIPPGGFRRSHALSDLPDLLSNFSRAGYLVALERAIEYIHAGDIFQVNLSQQLIHPQQMSSVELYRRLRERNPAPFAAFFEPAGRSFALASASPERFLSCDPSGRVETRPIKGTRRRRTLSEADFFVREELRESAKDRSENVMIVDLLRNDLSRVCRAGSVTVPQLFKVESFPSVHHLVSVVRAQLEPDRGPLDLLRAAFPGGSITGAPKIRAMEIIHELEPAERGAYCGSLGYIGFDGAMDTSILIRTVTCSRGWFHFPVGGGIVAASSPEREYEETLDKARGIVWALEPDA